MENPVPNFQQFSLLKLCERSDIMALKNHKEQHCIYLCTNKVNGKMYIGATNDFTRRMNEHKNHHKRYRKSEYDAHSELFYDAIREFGWDNFTKEIILECDSFEEREIKEQEMIALYKKKYGEDMMYNYCKGGRGGQTHDMFGEKNPMYGKHWNEDKKKQMASKLKGRKDSDETRKKKSKALKGKKKNPKSYEHRCKPLTIINTNTGEIRKYSSQSEMERDKINRETILKGGITRKGWKLLEEGQETTESADSEKDTIE